MMTEIRIVSRGANSVVVEVRELPGDRILTFIDAAYPGWHAYVDGERVPIMRANDAFKAVSVPPGTHVVEFAFRPSSVYAGMTISCVTLLALGGLLCRAWQWPRRVLTLGTQVRSRKGAGSTRA